MVLYSPSASRGLRRSRPSEPYTHSSGNLFDSIRHRQGTKRSTVLAEQDVDSGDDSDADSSSNEGDSDDKVAAIQRKNSAKSARNQPEPDEDSDDETNPYSSSDEMTSGQETSDDEMNKIRKKHSAARSRSRMTSSGDETDANSSSDEEDSDDEPTPEIKKMATIGRKMRRKECTICCESIVVTRFPLVPNKASHDHEQGICVGCWPQYLSGAIEDHNWDAVRCPECEIMLDNKDIRKLATAKTYQEWLHKAAKTAAGTDEEFRACPSASCSWGCFFSTEEDGNIFTCQECEYRWCVTCEAPMHEEETCADYQVRSSKKRKREDKASEKLVAARSKACPKCTVRMQKSSGCDHMTCTRCQHEFCWPCLAPYRGSKGIDRVGNTAHEQYCAHYA